jgi:pimeloyl-ACP methyl ester carboxylesterase
VLGYRHFAQRDRADGRAGRRAKATRTATRRDGNRPPLPARSPADSAAWRSPPCTLAPDFGTARRSAVQQLQVPEDRAPPAGRKIALAIAWVPAKGDGEPDPVFMLAGGPGQSALESFPSISSAFTELRKKRNVILVDQRGTGGSNKLVCKDSEGQSAVVGGRGLQPGRGPRVRRPLRGHAVARAPTCAFIHQRRDPGLERCARRSARRRST